ncbi:hypothetical protein QQ73_01940 [Candidatus Endoriftia persephone str. Guaymas]|nr:hypothetical protein [Candidatus Endoriftia persephone str. Guaymas]
MEANERTSSEIISVFFMAFLFNLDGNDRSSDRLDSDVGTVRGFTITAETVVCPLFIMRPWCGESLTD